MSGSNFFVAPRIGTGPPPCSSGSPASPHSGGLAQALLANASGLDNETDYTGQPVIGAYRPSGGRDTSCCLIFAGNSPSK